jgi:hypothetical protein
VTARTYVGGAGTLNLGGGSTTVKLSGVLQMIALGELSILGTQEGTDRAALFTAFLRILQHPAAAARRATRRRRQRRDVRKALRVMHWRVFRPTVPGGSAVTSCYDAKQWQLLRTRSLLAVARIWVGAVGAGPTWSKAKIVNVLILRHRETREIVEHLNTHMIPSAGRHNLPERERRARRHHYADHAARIVKRVRHAEKRGHGVVLTMDANAGRLSDLVKPFREAGLIGWTTGETMHGQGIDHVLNVSRGLVVGAPARVIPLHGFDHRGVVRALYVKAAA